jgi:glycosyltransferase involved in cell wall biosynthesis
MDLNQITPLILTFNEKENIARSIAPLSWAKEILIVDSGSTDGTLEIARAAHPTVRIVTRDFDSFAGQCNFGLAQIETDWVLSMDADYVLTPELIREIEAIHESKEIAGYSAEFRYCIFGHPLRSSLYPARTVLYQRTLAKYRDEGHGHRANLMGGVGRLSGKILHDDRKPFTRWLGEQDRYAILEARHLLAQPITMLNFQDRLRRKIFLSPAAMFIYLLCIRGLIFDGWPGWFYVFQRTVAELLLSLRLLIEKQARGEREDG